MEKLCVCWLVFKVFEVAFFVDVCATVLLLVAIVVEQRATLLDLRNAIKHYMNLKLSRDGVRKKLSW